VIGNVSSIGAWRGGAGIGLYCTSKWAVSGISETLTYELADFNIKVCAIEPGYFRSNFLNPGNRLVAKAHIPDYDGRASRKTAAGLEEYNNNQPGHQERCMLRRQPLRPRDLSLACLELYISSCRAYIPN
jgi:NAD(P)-dependent dehydrogenase (short-subunit alcohol dehydrogenase family)